MAPGDVTVRVDLDEVIALLSMIIERFGDMATQADIDALTAQISAIGNRLGTALADIRRDIGDLKAQGVDTSALEASVARLGTTADDAAALAAENPAPPAG